MRSKRTVRFSVCIRFRVTFTGKTDFFLHPVALVVKLGALLDAPRARRGGQKQQ